jgi:hypothetical protein
MLLALFAIAMGALEAIVVVYLRQIYYPLGFDFPLTLLSPRMLTVESSREAATIVMLVAVGILAGRDTLQRFTYFLYTFAVWDIFYYVCLKLLLDWPSSFLTWDVLFLIPVPWIGPVLAPLICSLTMILLAGIIIYLKENGCMIKIKLSEWSMALLGASIILFTFARDYSKIIFQEHFSPGLSLICKERQLIEIISGYKPTHYNWNLFLLGEILILCSLIMLCRSATAKKMRKEILREK